MSQRIEIIRTRQKINFRFSFVKTIVIYKIWKSLLIFKKILTTYFQVFRH